jgi:thiol-disulfide isomerase/thioredoxin
MSEVLWILVGVLALLFLAWVFTMNKSNNNDSNRVAGASRNMIVRCYSAGWCGACRRFAPQWQELVDMLGSQFDMRKMDCTDSKEAAVYLQKVLKNGQKITGYPTVTIQRNGDEEEILDRSGLATTEQFSQKLKSL